MDSASEFPSKFSNHKYIHKLKSGSVKYQQISNNKNTSDTAPLFRKCREVSGKKPQILITDGAPNLHETFNKEFFTLKNLRTRHIRHIRIQGDRNNNKMERMNGEIRDKEKVRGLKKDNTAILARYQLYHNYLRPHKGLDGRTTAELLRIIIQEKINGRQSFKMQQFQAF